MEAVVERPAALDVHKAKVTACARVPGVGGRREQYVAEFSSTVRGLLELRDWLAGHGVTQVVMEATGVRKACGNRREAVCPSCAERYRGDAYQLIAAGRTTPAKPPPTSASRPKPHCARPSRPAPRRRVTATCSPGGPLRP